VSAATFEAAVASALAQEGERRMRRATRAAIWIAASVAVLWFTAAQIGLNPAALARGVPFMLDFFSRMFPPDLEHLALLGGATVETLQIAVWGTLIAIVMSIPLALLGAKNTTPHIVVFHATRMFLNALRAINELVFALIFVAAVG
jgi:phosphonate transport system permease protein